MRVCETTGKVCYPTKQKAYKMANELKGYRGRELMKVYKCEHCKEYHLTHKNHEL